MQLTVYDILQMCEAERELQQAIDDVTASVANIGLGARRAAYNEVAQPPEHKASSGLRITIPSLHERQSQRAFDMSCIGDALMDVLEPVVEPIAVEPVVEEPVVQPVAKKVSKAAGGRHRRSKDPFDLRTIRDSLPALQAPVDAAKPSRARRQSTPPSQDEASSSDDGGRSRSRPHSPRASPYSKQTRGKSATATDPAIDLFFASLIRATSLDDNGAVPVTGMPTRPRGILRRA